MAAVLVASTPAHGAAMMHWLKLDPKDWRIVCYGDDVNHFYSHGILVHPLEEINEDYAAWLLAFLAPRLIAGLKTMDVVPPSWKLVIGDPVVVDNGFDFS